MAVFEHPEYDAHEQVVFFHDRESGLRAIVALHRLGRFGAAGGGCRMWPYPDSGEALRDVLRLSRAMTWKLALAELPAGGAKTVIIGDPRKDKSEALFEALGRCIQSLGGRYVVAEDVGTTPADMEIIARKTPFVLGRQADTGPATGHGVFEGLRAAARHGLDRSDLDGVTVAVQGLGGVGWALIERLVGAGARVVATDLDPARTVRASKAWGIDVVPPEAILDQRVDILAPCAMGDVVDDATLDRLQCRVIAGGANNQLRDPDRHAAALADRGILYAPDFAMNAGGVIAASFQSPALGDADAAPFDEAAATEAAGRVGPLIDTILTRATDADTTPYAAAVQLARERLGEVR
jgi:leucine dehydrogenase